VITVVVIAAVAVGAAVLALVSRNGSENGPKSSRTTPGAAPSSSEPAGLTAGMRQIFGADFGGQPLDSGTWSTCYPWADNGSGCTNFGNPEVQWYLPSQVQVDGNALHLVAARAPTVGKTQDGGSKTYPWRSGMVTTYRSLVFTYGLVEVDARIPRGDGLWTTLWLLPQDQSFPPEIDVAEVYGVTPDQLSVVYHPAPSGRAFKTVDTDDLSSGFHRYAVDWQPDSITWYLDGKEVYEYRGRTPSQPMYFLANLAVANLFGAGPTASTPSPASLDIRSVAVYQR
jgi:beta-glucanase (GH16 family)